MSFAVILRPPGSRPYVGGRELNSQNSKLKTRPPRAALPSQRWDGDPTKYAAHFDRRGGPLSRICVSERRSSRGPCGAGGDGLLRQSRRRSRLAVDLRWNRLLARRSGRHGAARILRRAASHGRSDPDRSQSHLARSRPQCFRHGCRQQRLPQTGDADHPVGFRIHLLERRRDPVDRGAPKRSPGRHPGVAGGRCWGPRSDRGLRRGMARSTAGLVRDRRARPRDCRDDRRGAVQRRPRRRCCGAWSSISARPHQATRRC